MPGAGLRGAPPPIFARFSKFLKSTSFRFDRLDKSKIEPWRIQPDADEMENSNGSDEPIPDLCKRMAD